MFNKVEINKKYFEDKNFNRLMSKLYNYFSKSYNYKVGNDEEELCQLIMSTTYKHNNPTTNENRVNFIKRLNRLSLNELIRMITSKMNEINNTPDLVRDELLADQGDNIQNKVANFPTPRQAGQKNTDVTNNFEQISKERDENLNRPVPNVIPEFQMQMEENNADIEKAFAEVQKKFDQDRKDYEASEKVEKDLEGNDILIKKETPTEPLASNINNDQDLLIQDDDDSKIIKSEDFKKNKLLIPQPKQYANVIKDIYNTVTKDYYIVVDSRDRNHDLYSNPNNYQVEFDNVLRSVISIELMSAELPAVQYNINENNNILHFNEGGDTLEAEIDIGQYDSVSDLKTALQTALNAAGSSGDYTVTTSTITRKFTITKGAGTFGMEFEGDSENFVQSQTRTKYLDNSIGSVIGFSRNDLSGEFAYTGDNQYNLSGENYVLLYIKELENLESVSGNSTIHDTFTKINLDAESSNVKFYSQLDEYISRVTFVPPLASIGQMLIKFYNYDGSFYDFGGREHSLYFKITTFNQPTEYFQG